MFFLYGLHFPFSVMLLFAGGLLTLGCPHPQNGNLLIGNYLSPSLPHRGDLWAPLRTTPLGPQQCPHPALPCPSLRGPPSSVLVGVCGAQLRAGLDDICSKSTSRMLTSHVATGQGLLRGWLERMGWGLGLPPFCSQGQGPHVCLARGVRGRHQEVEGRGSPLAGWPQGGAGSSWAWVGWGGHC